MRSDRKALTALFLCLALLLPIACISVLAGHDCVSHCPICPVLKHCRELTSQLCLRSEAVGWMAVNQTAGLRMNALPMATAAEQTLVALKVELLS